MCGRYRLSRRKQLVEEYFDSVSGEDDWTPRYNIAPTQSVPVIRQNPKEPRRELSLMRWGLIPSWAKDMSGAAMMINARSETAATKPAFRDPLTSRRCLVPADGFYEWQQRGKTKHVLRSRLWQGQLDAIMSQTTRNQVSIQKQAFFRFVVPPRAEQRRIVAKLDGLMALCDRLEAQLSTVQRESGRLLESVLHHALITLTHLATSQSLHDRVKHMRKPHVLSNRSDDLKWPTTFPN
jgi:hypothetical protein